MAAGAERAVVMPLAGWAQGQLDRLALATRSRPLAELSAASLLRERAALNRFVVPGRVSAGGGSRIYRARDGAVALGLPRADDRATLPALFGDPAALDDDEAALIARIACMSAPALVSQGRLLGLPIARVGERPASPAIERVTAGIDGGGAFDQPLVVDLSALWAGPLAANLLAIAGARVVRVESIDRPDVMRHGDPALFALLNGGKASVALDLRSAADRAHLIALVRRASVVIEAARPRALMQLGIDAAMLVREVPGLAWITITGHGVRGEAASWTGLGDDCGVAGGLSAALLRETGVLGFVGDAIADPLSGIVAAREAAAMLATGRSGRAVVSMSGVVHSALASERARDPVGLAGDLRQWAAAIGLPFGGNVRAPRGPVADLGADTREWTGRC